MSERSLIIIKPDGIQRALAGSIISRFESKGLRIAAARLMRISVELAQEHYEAHADKYFFDRAVEYISSAPVLLIVLEGSNAIEVCRKLTGATFSYEAAPGTIRGDYSASKRFNLVHASDSPEAAQREIALYFKPEEILDYELCARKWL
ncbi:MAG: nucleoside-diphosphate kinase [Anaerohalosphaeraceae bacterium]|nr:nucleoside-diphosphate kinase [Anaerohalosphaeraceae bacterium]